MFLRYAMAVMAGVLLVGCGRQPSSATTVQAASSQTASARDDENPANSPILSAEAARDAAEKPAPDVRPTATILAGTRIRVRLAQALDTKFTRPGSVFSATLDLPVVAGNRVVVPKGTRFWGTVAEARKSGRFRGRAVLGLALRSFRLNGVTYRVVTGPNVRVSGSHKKRNLALMGGGPAAGAGIGAAAGGGSGALIGAGVGAAAGAPTAFITGRKDVRLPAETPMVSTLRSGIKVRRG